MTPLLRPADVAALLGVSRSSAYALMGRMPHVKIGGILRVAESELQAYVRRHTVVSCVSTDAKARKSGGHSGATVVNLSARRTAKRPSSPSDSCSADRLTRPIVHRTRPLP